MVGVFDQYAGSILQQILVGKLSYVKILFLSTS